VYHVVVFRQKHSAITVWKRMSAVCGDEPDVEHFRPRVHLAEALASSIPNIATKTAAARAFTSVFVGRWTELAVLWQRPCG